MSTTPSGTALDDPSVDTAVTAPLPLQVPPRPTSRVPGVLAAIAVVAVVAGALVWHLTGGRWQIITTPSMGTAAPVGSVVLTRPDGTPAVGDVVSFRPPAPDRTTSVTHRVVAVEPGPVFRTRGDINGAPDPWLLHPSDLTGTAVAIVPGLGWLIRALPALIAGTALLWWVTRRWMPWLWAVPTRVLGLSVLLAATSLVLRPFVGTVTLATLAEAGEARLTLVSTGLLPTRITADTGGRLDLISGQVGLLTTPRPPEARGNVLTSGVHLPWWLWILMTALWLLPMLYGLFAARRRPLAGPPPDDPDPGPPAAPSASTADDEPRRRARPVVTTFLGLTLAIALTTVTSPSTAAFTGSVTDTANTAAANPYFTCAGALTGLGSAYVAWPLDDATVTNGATARGLATSPTTGTYTGPFTTATSKPCPRDTPARAVTFAPTLLTPSSVVTTNPTAIASTNVFSIVLWFRTTTSSGGKLAGWSTGRTPSVLELTGDRQLYMTNDGKLVFGVYPNAYRTVTSPNAYNDDAWHLAVATLSPAGMALYVDGDRVASDASTTTAQSSGNGYWRLGYGNLAGWPSVPLTSFWTGSMSNAAVLTSALSAAQVAQLYRAGT